LTLQSVSKEALILPSTQQHAVGRAPTHKDADGTAVAQAATAEAQRPRRRQQLPRMQRQRPRLLRQRATAVRCLPSAAVTVYLHARESIDNHAEHARESIDNHAACV